MPQEYPVIHDFGIKWAESIAFLVHTKSKQRRVCLLHNVDYQHSPFSGLYDDEDTTFYVSTLVLPAGKEASESKWYNEKLSTHDYQIKELHTDPNLPAAGYFNYKNNCFYKSLLNRKQYRKGLHPGNCAISWTVLSDQVEHCRLTSPDIVRVISQPPSYPALRALGNGEAQAINKHFAVSRSFSKTGEITIHFKGSPLLKLKEFNTLSRSMVSTELRYFLDQKEFKPICNLIYTNA